MEYKEWVASPEYGRIVVTVSAAGILVEIADDPVQRNYGKVCQLADYATETPTDGWTPIRQIIADDFPPEQRAEIEAYIAELLQAAPDSQSEQKDGQDLQD